MQVQVQNIVSGVFIIPVGPSNSEPIILQRGGQAKVEFTPLIRTYVAKRYLRILPTPIAKPVVAEAKPAQVVKPVVAEVKPAAKKEITEKK